MEDIKLINRQLVSRVLKSLGICVENDSYYETILKNRDLYIDQLNRELEKLEINMKKNKQKLRRTTYQERKLSSELEKYKSLLEEQKESTKKYKNLLENQKESTRDYENMVNYLQKRYSRDNFVEDSDFSRIFIGVLNNCDKLLENIDFIYKNHIIPEVCREELAPYVTIIGKNLIEYLKNLGNGSEEEKIIIKLQRNISAVREIIYSINSYIV